MAARGDQCSAVLLLLGIHGLEDGQTLLMVAFPWEPIGITSLPMTPSVNFDLTWEPQVLGPWICPILTCVLPVAVPSVFSAVGKTIVCCVKQNEGSYDVVVSERRKTHKVPQLHSLGDVGEEVGDVLGPCHRLLATLLLLVLLSKEPHEVWLALSRLLLDHTRVNPCNNITSSLCHWTYTRQKNIKSSLT